MTTGLDRCKSLKLGSDTIGCIRAWLGRAKLGVNKDEYLV